MNMKKVHFAICLSVALLIGSAFGMGRKPVVHPVSMLVVPDDPAMIRIALDSENIRPCVLVSYERNPASGPGMIHVWDRQAWIPLSIEQFRSGRFLNVKPAASMVISDSSPLAQQMISGAESWVQSVYSVPTKEPTETINALGQFYDFDRSNFSYFASKYGLKLVNNNANLKHQSWYDKPYVDETKLRREAGRSYGIAPVESLPPALENPGVDEPPRTGGQSYSEPLTPTPLKPALPTQSDPFAERFPAASGVQTRVKRIESSVDRVTPAPASRTPAEVDDLPTDPKFWKEEAVGQ